MQRQQKAMMQALQTVLDAFKKSQTEQLSATLTQLGRQHREYGVKPEDYAKVGAVLLDTLADYDTDWSPKLNTAWTEAYGTVARMMEPATA